MTSRHALLPAITAAVVFALAIVLPFAGCGLKLEGLPGDPDGGSPCTADAQCDDINPCTTDACTAGGTCSHLDQPDGPAPSSLQTAFDCKVVMCAGGVEKDENDNADILVDAEDCTIDTCTDGQPFHTAKGDGLPCTTMGGDGRCSGGKCGIICTLGDKCDDSEPCTEDSCDVGQGTCSHTPLNGVTPPGVAQKAGDCKVQICVEGKLESSSDDSDTLQTATDCDAELCADGKVANENLKADVSCGANKALVCDGGGNCVQCNSPDQCPGLDNDCQVRSCAGHMCGITFSPLHTPRAAPFQNANDCHVVVCDGMGNTAATDDVDDTDYPDDGNLCTKDICTNGAISHPFAPANTTCGVNGACNATGQCGCANDTACVMPTTCGGGNPGTPFVCGCTAKTCSSLGKTCGMVPDGCFATLSCNTGTKDGAETDVDCGGNAAGCGTTCAIAKQCNVNSDCGSGFCADGVCCNSACNGTCQACTNAKKGGGADGVCGSIALGLEDQNSSMTCVSPKACDGANNCKKNDGQTCAASLECLHGNCIDGVCCNVACNGTCLACTAAKKGSGSDGTCGNIPINQPDTVGTTTCTGTNSCDGAGGCKKNVGQTCMTSPQCVNGNCADGICCGSACTETCKACNIAGSLGTCTSLATGSVDTNATIMCVAPSACDGSGNCKKVNGQTCGGNAECVSNNCIDGYCCGSACTETCKACNVTGSLGTCTNVTTGSPDPMTCSAPSACDAGVCKKGNGQACGGNTECTSSNCIDGYCCSTACTETCKACNVTGSLGTCTNIATGSIDNNATMTCTAPSACDTGTCKKGDGLTCATGTDCVNGNCIDGVCCNTDCLGTCMSCNNMGSVGTCSNAASNTTDDNATVPCNGSSVCDGMGNGAGSCKVKTGQACTPATAANCLTGLCADNVCCNTTCDAFDTCMSCNQAATLGTCSVVSNADDGDSCIPATSTCSAAGTCVPKALTGAPCTVGANCASGVCASGMICQ